MRDISRPKTTPPPHIELAAQLKADAINIAQALKNTEEHGKEKPVLLWIYFHKGADYTEHKQAKITPPRMVPLRSIPNDTRKQKHCDSAL
jgi:hypothetical protein